MIQCSPCILLGCVLIIAKVHYRELEHSLREPINGKTAKVIIYLKKERSAIKENVSHFLLRLLPPCLPYAYALYRHGSLPLALPSADVPLYCFDLMLVKSLILFVKKIRKREQMQTKTLYNLLFYINADYNIDAFSRLRLYCTSSCTHWLRQHTFEAYYQYILLENPGMNFVSHPRNVPRHKQGRLTMYKNLSFFAQCIMMEFYRKSSVFATF